MLRLALAAVLALAAFPALAAADVLPGQDGRIAFVSDRVDTNIYTMNPDGTDVRQMTTKGGNTPAWSPDGRRLAYIGHNPFAVRVMDADGGNDRLLAGVHAPLVALSWSPDGTRIYTDDPALPGGERVGQGQIAWVDANAGGDWHVISAPFTSDDDRNGAVDVSPQGTVAYRQGSSDTVVYSGLDGGPLRAGPANLAPLAWTADGARLVVSQTLDVFTTHPVIMAPDGSGAVDLLAGSPLTLAGAAPAPSGTSVLFGAGPAGASDGFRLYRVPPGGGTPVPITAEIDNARWPDWAPVPGTTTAPPAVPGAAGTPAAPVPPGTAPIGAGASFTRYRAIWHRDAGRRWRLTRLTLVGIVPGARIAVRCAPRRCTRVRHAGKSGLAVLNARWLRGVQRLVRGRSGRVEVRVTAPGKVGRLLALRHVTGSEEPAGTVYCLSAAGRITTVCG